MPRYFFNLYDDDISLDPEGSELDSLDEARRDATINLRSLAAEQVLTGRLSLEDRIEIADQTGAVLDTVSMRDCVELEG
jgi:hypothetical protein